MTGVRVGDLLDFFDFSSGELVARRRVVAMTAATDQNPTVGVILVRPVTYCPLDCCCKVMFSNAIDHREYRMTL